ncbi:hypothetical protein BU16DRAFT_522339 [Lophium mytilinum]|uniref:RNA recognition motif-containing protein n=1 Tax=Lophium mytilinum TaxID=390894 RepID=A0A6A6RAA8_9PEZI|nr:hypothetical protein BU16DRAFT_522339 [Lophium mytilinum]
MPQQQGEVSLLTLFADVHYFFGPPSAKPPHHAFDKSSYVYLYHNPIHQRGRLEVANHAGTPEQTAFSGFTDSVRVEQSYKHPTLFTITVDAFRGQGNSASSSPQQDLSQWHLPAPDPRNDGKYMYGLHTVDIYFWTTEDASLFLDSLKRVLQPHQLQILEAPAAVSTAPPDHRDTTMSPVVEKLEQAAISRNYPARSVSISTTQSFNGPPTVPTPASTVASGSQHEAPASFAPMAYNPAAPAAPEPIAHREKTPPPPDAEAGTGLTAAAISDHQGQFGAPPYHQNSFAPQATNQPYMPGPPSRQPTQGFPGPPTPGIQRSNTSGSFPPPPPQSSSAGPPQGQGYAHSFAPPPQEAPPQPGIHRQATMPASMSQQYANYPASPGYAPVQSPGHPPTPGYPQAPGYPAAQSPGFPPQGGYPQYAYGQTPDQYGVQNSLHTQLYRPTESEALHGKQPAVIGAGPGVQPGNFERRTDKIEKGVGRFLKKLDKRM